ncbi:pilus assembly protein PilM [Microbacterium terricola]|uniref:Pilus assembly protein PilM n=1 Tax=Microbacterium terricola TaxID=344163 RepID=A0ABM8DXX0_9MICO|nr:pilus assembly protein PilM [Microbacterium terricola]UYK38944.1 pilus assembly protein PilM [Microbacterium terricola]BDV30356.1 pilus assembly protein PilM [Microbacterium terricola]
MAKTVIGLEITEESVRAAEVTMGRNPTLVAYGSVPLPPEAARDSEVIDRDAIALALRQLWSRAGFKAKNVVLGVGSRRILVREYTTQAMRPDLLRQALPYQVQDLLPVPAEQAVLDFYPVSQDRDQLTGLLVAAVAETIEDLITTVGKAKLVVDEVDLSAFAVARAAKRVAAAGETVAVLALGDHTSNVVVMRDGIPHFVRIIPIDIATPAVQARSLSLTSEDSEQAAPVVLEEVLETVPPEPQGRRSRVGGRVRSSVGMSDAAIGDLVARLRSTIAFYSERVGEQPVTRVLLTGAGAAVPGVAEALGADLPMPVEYVGVAQVMSVKGEAPEGDLALDLLTTAGIAMKDGR